MNSAKSPDFDPYYEWLGIARQHQPPNLYRLLGIDLFESDAKVIDAATNRISSYLRDITSGPHRAASQRLLNEIAAARRLLLDAKRKAEYEAKLKAELGEGATAKLPTIEPDASSTSTIPRQRKDKTLTIALSIGEGCAPRSSAWAYVC